MKKISSIIKKLDLLANVLPFFGTTKDWLILMKNLWKDTNGYLNKFAQVIMKNILKDWRKEVKNLKITQEILDNLLKDKRYLMYKLEINISTLEDYMMINRILNYIRDDEPDLKDSIVSLNVDNAEMHPIEFNTLFNRIKRIGIDPFKIKTYTWDLNNSIPYLSTCFLNQQTPLEKEFLVETLTLDSLTNINVPKLAWSILYSWKIKWQNFRVRDTYIMEMYDRRKNYSQNLKDSTSNIIVRIGSQTESETLFNSIKWTIENQLLNIRDVVFSFDSNIDINILQCIWGKIESFKNIEIKEEEIFFGDYIQSHYSNIWIYLSEEDEWLQFYVHSFRWSYHSLTDVYKITKDYIILKSWKEIELDNIIKTKRLQEWNEVKFEESKNKQWVIVIPKDKIFVNHIMNINTSYLPDYTIKTNNILVINHIDFQNFNEIVKLKTPSHNMDIDLEFYDSEVTLPELETIFNYKVRYLTLRSAQLSSTSFQKLLSLLSWSSFLCYLEFHDLDWLKTANLLQVLKKTSNILKLVLCFKEDEEDMENIWKEIREYKEERKFTVVMVNGYEIE